jgi:Flp pilus assembly protein TadD
MSLPSVQDGLALHQAGDLDKARSVYVAVLAERPDDPTALHYLGVIAQQTGKRQEAMELMRRSIAAAPDVPDFHCNLGVLLRDCRRLDEAAAALCHAVRLRPRYPEALSNLGDVLRQQGKLAEAESVLRQSIAVKPSGAAMNNLGLVLIERDKPAQAAPLLRRAVELNADDLAARKNLGSALRLSGQTAAAVEVLQAATELAPRDADAWFGLGNALRAAHDTAGAAAAYRRAHQIRPEPSADLLVNLAGALVDCGEIDAAIATGCKAVALAGNSPGAKYNLALALLLSGRLEEGWNLYESRWGCEGFLDTLPLLPRPLWDGSDPSGLTVLLRAEQGCGDTIQFARYVPLLAERGARIILECQPELKSLMASLCSRSVRVIARGEDLCNFDCHLPLLSLPYFWRTTVETIPASTPYLRPDGGPMAAWASRLAGVREFKCGLVWAGNPLHRNDHHRSMPLSALAPLASINGVRFFSLQKERRELASGFPGLVDLAPDLNDYSDTAAALAHLDLLISVDTSVVHLAGAMGRPVWTLLPRVPDWRWMMGTDRTPWYPTMRLLRQSKEGDWASVVAKAGRELGKCTAAAEAA